MPQRRVALPFVVAWGVFATYLLGARIVGNFFPLSVFDMYRGHAPQWAARVVAVDASGRTAELDAFEAFACDPDPPPLRDVERICGPAHRPLGYVVRDQELWLLRHGGSGDEEIAIVSRARALDNDATDECVIARCSATRRGASP